MVSLLLVAPTCDRSDVGEAWVAYQWASRLARRHDVTLLTYRKRGRDPVAQQVPDARVIEWVEPPLLGRAERLNSMLKPGYLPFYLRARRWIRGAMAGGERFDIGHQPLPVAMRYPSPLQGLGIPYVMGPVGGSMDSPPGFRDQDTSPWYVNLRKADAWRIGHDPLMRSTYAGADCVIGIAPYVRDFLGPMTLRRFEAMPETGIEELPATVDRASRTGPLRLLFVGRLIRTKGARDAIAAMDRLRDIDVVLDIVGDGFDRAACEDLCRTLGLGDRVRFHGALARTQVDHFYRDADVFVFPSYREPGGNVAFEAMAMSLPLVVNDRGGPGNAVDDSCGFRLPAVEPGQYAAAIADAIRVLHRDPARRLAMGAAARRRVAEIGLWDAKVDAMSQLYQAVMETGGAA